MPSKVELLEARHGKPLRQILEEAFATHGNQSEVAKSLGVHQSTVSLWLLKLGLEQVTTLRPVERAS